MLYFISISWPEIEEVIYDKSQKHQSKVDIDQMSLEKSLLSNLTEILHVFTLLLSNHLKSLF
jgi:hypothetical protein